WLTGNNALAPQRVPVFYSNTERTQVDRRLLELGITLSSAFVAVHPFAKFQYREWDISRYLDLGGLIEKRLSIPVVFLSEVDDRRISDKHRLLSKLSIKALAYLLERTTLLIGNNSGPMHLAAAMGTPTVVIQGPSAPQWDVYWKDTSHVKMCSNFPPCIPCERIGHVPGRCLNEEYPRGCLQEISVDAVFDCVTAVLMNLPAGAKVNLDGK
ncbi:MAG TPA: glycosyltransferase family 9 protein, partial [Nitrososphaera sp.]|nr:glycosyltransferase family 9 protein [Nitrososphaera sp.]